MPSLPVLIDQEFEYEGRTVQFLLAEFYEDRLILQFRDPGGEAVIGEDDDPHALARDKFSFQDYTVTGMDSGRVLKLSSRSTGGAGLEDHVADVYRWMVSEAVQVVFGDGLVIEVPEPV